MEPWDCGSSSMSMRSGFPFLQFPMHSQTADSSPVFSLVSLHGSSTRTGSATPRGPNASPGSWSLPEGSEHETYGHWLTRGREHYQLLCGDNSPDVT